MKNSEIQALTIKELQSKIDAEVASYSKMKFTHAITPVENPMVIRSTRKLIARLKTELNAKQAKA